MNANRRTRVALFATHPVQYHEPWFRALGAMPGIELKVFFGMVPDPAQQGIGFGVSFRWDIPLRSGYDSELLQNVAKRPSIGVFGGCDTPDVLDRLRSWSPDVVILTGWQSKMLVQAWWAAVRLRLPRIVRGESNALRDRGAWKRFLHRAWLHGFDEFLSIGRSNRDFYMQGGVPAKRIHDCPYFVDNQRFRADADHLRERRTELRRAWSIPADATCFLFCGKLVSKKRPHDVLRALGIARAAQAPVHLLVVGEGELSAQIRTAAERESLPATFAGFLNQTEIGRAYVAADCLVLPSDAGNLGLVVNEAIACGLPAIVSDRVGCGPDLVSAGSTGDLYPVGDVDALAQRLIECSRDPGRWRAMGEAARQRVLADYSVERAVDGTLAAIRAAMSGR